MEYAIHIKEKYQDVIKYKDLKKQLKVKAKKLRFIENDEATVTLEEFLFDLENELFEDKTISRRRRSEDDSYVDWAVYVVVLVLIVLPILGILYCACKSTMPATASVTPAPQKTTEN